MPDLEGASLAYLGLFLLLLVRKRSGELLRGGPYIITAAEAWDVECNKGSSFCIA